MKTVTFDYERLRKFLILDTDDYYLDEDTGNIVSFEMRIFVKNLVNKEGTCPICTKNDSEGICKECQKKHKTTYKKIMEKIKRFL